jgi:hypothetical protein
MKTKRGDLLYSPKPMTALDADMQSHLGDTREMSKRLLTARAIRAF